MSIKKRLLKEKEEFINIASEFMLKFGTKKDMGVQAYQNRELIHKYYDHFLKNYFLCMEYLRDDFKLKTITTQEPGKKAKTCDIDEDLEDTKTALKKIVNKTLLSKIKVKRFDISNLLSKWYVVTNFLIYYPQVLAILESKTDEKIYKEIDFESEKVIINGAKEIDEDFTLMLKWAKKHAN